MRAVSTVYLFLLTLHEDTMYLQYSMFQEVKGYRILMFPGIKLKTSLKIIIAKKKR